MHGTWGAATDPGRKRRTNEDSYLASTPVFMVADGMGGHDRGDLASALAVDEFSSLCQYTEVVPELIDSCFRRASARIKETLSEGVGGTTVCGVALALQDGAPYWLVFNIGDSRAYRYNSVRHTMAQISVDHSVVQELMDAGVVSQADAVHHAERHVITRALETVSDPEPDYWMIPVEGGDQILLCSDGLTDELTDAEILDIWSNHKDPQDAANGLVQEALSAGGRDNITTVIVTSDVVGYAANTAHQSTAPLLAIPELVEDDPADHYLAGSVHSDHTHPRNLRS